MRFQFLIGTIKTVKKVTDLEEKNLFQFLIGTIKTFFIFNSSYLISLFQFLIGTIKTGGLEMGLEEDERFNSL